MVYTRKQLLNEHFYQRLMCKLRVYLAPLLLTWFNFNPSMDM